MNDEKQWIGDWSVAGDNRVVGTVRNRPGQAGPRTIITSRVVQVRRMGETRTPVAFTESGSAYWLCEPSSRFGLDNAEEFVWRMSRSPDAAERSAGEHDRTVLLQLSAVEAELSLRATV